MLVATFPFLFLAIR